MGLHLTPKNACSQCYLSWTIMVASMFGYHRTVHFKSLDTILSSSMHDQIWNLLLPGLQSWNAVVHDNRRDDIMYD